MMGRRTVTVEEPRGHGRIELDDGTSEPTDYNLRVTQEVVEGVEGLRAIRGRLLGLSGAFSFRLINEGKAATLHLEDGRRVKLLGGSAELIGDGPVEVVATGGFLDD
jgi:hypothetical protein